MQFKRLANLLIQEAKNEKPGQRFHNARNSGGPGGMSASPIGTSRYNPTIEPGKRAVPLGVDKDTLSQNPESVRDSEIVLRNAFRLIKGDAGFRASVNKVLEAFNKKRKSITSAQEKVLTINPGVIDRLYGEKGRLERIVHAIGDEDTRKKQFEGELVKTEASLQKYTNQLDGVLDDVKDILGKNAESSLVAQDALIRLIQAEAKQQYDELIKGLSDESKSEVILTSLDQLSSTHFDEEMLDQEEMRIKLLSALLSEDEDQNPLYKFFYLADQNYKRGIESEAIFKRQKALTQNITVETLFNRLPTSSFSSFYNATRDDLPLRPLTGQRRKQVAAASPIRKVLDEIKDAESFEARREELRGLINALSVDEGRMTAINDILNGPYIRRGATATTRLAGLLRGVLKEGAENTNFDLVLLETLSKYGFA